MPPTTLTASQLTYVGKTPISNTPTSFVYCRGVALRVVNSNLKLFIWNSGNIIYEFDVPTNYTTTLSNPVNRGSLSRDTTANSVMSIFWDEDAQRMYQSYTNNYNTAATFKTLSRGYIDSGTGKLVGDGQNMTFGTSYKKLQGGITAIPAWFANTYLSGKRLGAGFGGGYSVLTAGPASMGPALAAFDPPPSTDGYLIPHTFLQQYPYSANFANPRQHRTTDYLNGFQSDVSGGFPYDPTIAGVGYWTWADFILGAGAWVDNDVVSGYVTMTISGKQCCWYGGTTVGACTGGTVSAINSVYKNFRLNITSPTDLALVASGSVAPKDIQSVYTPFQFPGIASQTAGFPNAVYMCRSMAWNKEKNRLAILVTGIGSNIPMVYWYSVSSGTTPPPPDAIPAPIVFAPLNGATGVAI
jgi:hypothetical protein